MDSREMGSGMNFQGRIDRKTHELGHLKTAFPQWEQLSKKEKLEASRKVKPVEKDTFYNVTTSSLHEYFVDNLDPDNESPEANVSVEFLGLGIDAASGTAEADTDLNDRVFEGPVTDVAKNGSELLASTFISSSDGNGNDFDELGLFSGDPANISDPSVFLINHAEFPAVTKDSTKTVTFDVTLTFSAQ
jgi:hypothetical protein